MFFLKQKFGSDRKKMFPRMFQFEEGMNVFSGNIKNQIIIYNLLYCIYYVGCRLGKSELKSDKFHYFDYFGFSRFASLNYRNLCFQIQKNSKIIFEKLPLQTKSLLLVTKVHFNTVKYILKIRLKDIVYACIYPVTGIHIKIDPEALNLDERIHLS